MRVRRGILVILLCLLIPGMASEAPQGTARCLLAACDRFVSVPSASAAFANNTEVMASLLNDFLPGEVSVTVRKDGADSAETLGSWMEEAFSGAGEEDLCLLYLSTHGIRGHDPETGTSLLLSDGVKEEALSPQELRGIMERIPGQKMLIVDACFSGGLIGMGTEETENAFAGSGCRVLVSGGAEEDSWFWNGEEDTVPGTGYFTAALNNALRASDPEQIDPDGDGTVSLRELTARLREIHGASTVYCSPEEDGEPLFFLPENRGAGSLLRAVRFGDVIPEEDTLTLPLSFRAEEPVRLMYLLVPSRGGRWDFEHAVRLPDREKTGLVRGLLRTGEKNRSIRLSRGSLGEDGRALFQIISLRGGQSDSWAEAGRVIENLPPGEEIPAEE